MYKKILCLIDGEHYLPVTQEAIETINKLEYNDVKAAVFIGGTEKLKNEDENSYSNLLGVPVKFGDGKGIPYKLIKEMIEIYNVDSVLDLSDEPILDYEKRFKIASLVLQENRIYEGTDFTFTPVTQYEIMEKPSLKILGTGKRIGKTAVSGFVSRLLHEKGHNPCVVAMGRGGPEEPEIVHGDEIEISPEFLLNQSAKGVHAASDHWEDALMSRILTIGCRRCGGGMAGETFLTNMKKGANLANKVDSEFVIFEGSGAAIPPIKTNQNIVLVGANQPINNVLKYFGPYRISFADLVIITMCEEPMANKEKIDYIEKSIKEINPKAKVIATVFRPKPLDDITGKKVLFATTAPSSVQPKLVEYLETNHDCTVVGITSNLANRPLLREDIKKHIKEADVMLTELKAAAVDVATKEAVDGGLEVVYCDNIPIPLDYTYPNLEKSVIDLVEKAIYDFNNEIKN